MEKKKVRFNFVDVIILLVLAAVIIFAAVKLIPHAPAESVDTDPALTDPAETLPEPQTWLYRVTFTAENVSNAVRDALEIGAPVTDDGCRLNLGELVSFKAEDCEGQFAVYGNDQIMFQSQENRSNITITVELVGVESPYGVNVDGSLLGIGHTIVVRAGYAKLWAMVSDIEAIEVVESVNS